MTDTPQQSPQTLREALVAKSTWFRFHQGTGEFTGEYCSVRPHDAAGMVPMVSVETALALAERPAIEREKIARLLCEQHGGDPDAVATDEHDCWEGPLWTAFTKDADDILALLPARSEPLSPWDAKTLDDAREQVAQMAPEVANRPLSPHVVARSEPAHDDPDDITYAGSEPVVDGAAEVRP